MTKLSEHFKLLGREKSVVLWASLALLIAITLMDYLNVDINQTIKTFIDVASTLFIAFGIVNNPTDRSNL